MYTCNNCSKNVETRYHCKECADFDLCVPCYNRIRHQHPMEKLGLGIEIDQPPIKQEGGVTNPKNVERNKNQRVQRCIQSLIHASRCNDEDCFSTCAKMKRLVQHTRSRSCQKKKQHSCTVCKQLIALCCYHSKHCDDDDCSVPFCRSIKNFMNQQQRRQDQRRRMMMMSSSGPSAPPPQPTPPQSPPPSQQPPPSAPSGPTLSRNAAEQAAQKALEVAKQQKIYSQQQHIIKTEMGNQPSGMGVGQGKPLYSTGPSSQIIRTMSSRMVAPNISMQMNNMVQQPPNHPHPPNAPQLPPQNHLMGLGDVTNPKDVERNKNQIVQRYIQLLIHACRCNDEDCFSSCAKMKCVVQHTRSCQKENHSCPICQQLLATCCYHPKHCDDDDCSVPFCPYIKQNMNQQQQPPPSAPTGPTLSRNAAEQAAQKALEVAKQQKIYSQQQHIIET